MLEAPSSGIEERMGSEGAPILKQLLIQQAALCWLKLNLIEIRYATVMKQPLHYNQGLQQQVVGVCSVVPYSGNEIMMRLMRSRARNATRRSECALAQTAAQFLYRGEGVEIGTLSGAAEVCETCGDFHRPAYRF